MSYIKALRIPLLSSLLICGIWFLGIGTAWAADAPPASAAVNAAPVAPASLVNINKVDLETLAKLKFMSKTKARSIIEYRTQNGPFQSLEDLLKVKCRGIHEAWLKKVSKFLTVS